MITPKTLLTRFQNLKTLPHIAIKLTKMINDDSCTIQEFEDIIKMDPPLVLRLLRIVNSPYYELRSKVESISDAVVYVGIENLLNMVIVTALKDIIKSNTVDEHFSRKDLWTYCVAVNICSQMIAENIFGIKGEDVFLCGILHDIGMIIEDQVIHDKFIEVCKAFVPDEKPVIFYEKEILGTDHCQVGYLLAQNWKLSEEIQNGIRLHHRKMNNIDPESTTGLIQISEYLVSRMNLAALPGMKGILSPPLMVHMKKNIGEYKMISKDLPDEMNKAKDIYDIDGD